MSLLQPTKAGCRYSREAHHQTAVVPHRALWIFQVADGSSGARTSGLEIVALGRQEATDLAADIIAVAKFYDLPLDVFLGIGAMENNYLSIRGDITHSIWKHKAATHDTILKRRRRRVLVSNYSVGVWQITRETLRYAHAFYLKDKNKRDYAKLPERLVPPDTLELDVTDPHVLTTCTGLLLRDLLISLVEMSRRLWVPTTEGHEIQIRNTPLEYKWLLVMPAMCWSGLAL